jgi:uncharacterized damage-inducible protein DinB
VDDLVADLRHEFRRHKNLADKAIAVLTDEEFFRRPAEQVNPVALIVKHLAGNLSSRWTDFLTSDGDKPSRDRDAEFVLSKQDTRQHLLQAWERGWQALFDTLDCLKATDFDRQVTIRGEVHTARQALLRGMSHVAYHTGQILYLARLLRPETQWLTIAPGQSRNHVGAYRKS